MTNSAGAVTVGACVRAHAQAVGGRPAFLTSGTTLSWAGYDEGADRVSATLTGAGIGPGDRVAVVMPDGPGVHATFVGAERIGAVVVGIGFRAGIREIEHLVTKTDASALVTQKGTGTIWPASSAPCQA